MTEPDLPYLGTEGYVTRPASIARANSNVRSGVAQQRQTMIMNALLDYPEGVTWVELGERLHLHHGQVSSTLSVLHAAGKIFALRETRNRCHPYVHGAFSTWYTDYQRFDEPTRTNGKVLKSRIDNAIGRLEDAVLFLNDSPVSAEIVDVYALVQQALAILNGERDEG